MSVQGYEGASSISSEKVGVQVHIRREAPLATYVRCNGHCLNLVIKNLCFLPEVRNVVDRLQDCCSYFLNCPKISGSLELVVKNNVADDAKRKPLLDFCKIR